MNFEDLDDVNKAKQKILYLLKMKYSDSTAEYDITDDTDTDSSLNNITNLLKQSGGLLAQVITDVKREKDQELIEQDVIPGAPIMTTDGSRQRVRKGVPLYEDPVFVDRITLIPGHLYFRSTASYQKFTEQLYKLLENLKQINLIFVKIINNIGYVEPANMRLYEEAFGRFKEYYQNFADMTSDENGQFNVTIKDTTSTFEKSNLITDFTKINNEKDKLVKYNADVRNTYNYKNSIMKTKRSPINGNETDNNNYDDDEQIIDCELI